jgi:hypothetical protein
VEIENASRPNHALRDGSSKRIAEAWSASRATLGRARVGNPAAVDRPVHAAPLVIAHERLLGDTHVSGETDDDVSAEEYASGESRVTETRALVAQGTEAAA